MADVFNFSGSWSVTPATGFPSGDTAFGTPVCETTTLVAKMADTITLATDAPVSVNFGGVTKANVVILKTVGGKVRARFTSPDGALQAVPVYSFFTLIDIDPTDNITAIDLTRDPGQLTYVYVFLGQRA